MTQEPRSEGTFEPRLRDTLYLDIARIRSLLAQLRGGVVEAVVERWSNRDERRLGVRLLGLEGGGNLLDEASVEQTTTLQDALFDIFEEAAEEVSLFRDAVVDDASRWRNGSVHQALKPGQLIRVTAPMQILDAEHVGGELARAIESMEAFAYFQEAQDPTPLPSDMPLPPEMRSKRKRIDPEEWRQAAIAARAEAIMGMPLDGAVALRVMFEKILGGGISVRVFPCGPEHLDITIAGRLATREGYLWDEHDTLFAKYGWGSSEWTVVAQLATVPVQAEKALETATPTGSPSEGQLSSEGEPEKSSESTDDDTDGVLNRAEFEAMGIDLMKTFAEAGFMGAPVFPGMTMTPIAIYREVPLHQN